MRAKSSSSLEKRWGQMNRTRVLFTILTAIVLALPSIPAAADGEGVPADPNIVDPAGDASFLPVVVEGVSEVPEGDILAAWLTNDRETITAHWHVTAPPTYGSGIQLQLDGVPGNGDPRRCLYFTAVWRLQDGQPYRPYTAFADLCNNELEEVWLNGVPRVTTLADGSAIVSAKAPLGFFDKLLKPGTRVNDLRALSAYAHWIQGRRPVYEIYDQAGPGKIYRVRP